MKILLTGANGQVGKEIFQSAQQQGITIFAFGHQQLDITQPSALLETLQRTQPNLLINAAAYTAVEQAETDAKSAFLVNRDAVEYLVHSCQRFQIPLIHLSTDYVFDGKKQEAYTESDTAQPINVYGQSKWQGEEIIRKHLTQYLIVRTSWVFGLHGHNFVKTMIQLAQTHQQLDIVSNAVGCPTSAKSIAVTVLRLAKAIQTRNFLHWGTYHFSNQGRTTWYEFAQVIFEHYKHRLMQETPTLNPVLLAEYPSQVQRPLNTELNCKKIQQIFQISQPQWKAELQEVMQGLSQEIRTPF